MKFWMRIATGLLLAVSFLAAPVMAEEPSLEDMAPLGMVTGQPTGTYVKFGGDISKVAARNGLRVDVKESNGSIDNIKRISSDENAALGIVQSDVLGYLSRSKNPESLRVAKNLRLVFPFYHEEVHVLARKNIRDFRELTGRRVVVGSQGSGSWLTAMNLMAMMDVRPNRLLRLDSTEGVVAVLKGNADAMVFVGGKPVKLFKNLEELAKMQDEGYQNLLNGVHFLALQDESILKEYVPSLLSPEDYSFMTKEVPTVAVTAMLVSYNFADQPTDYSQERCYQLSQVAEVIRSNMPVLREEGHPKWKEVDLSQPVGLWQMDPCVSIQPRSITAQNPDDPLEKELLSTVADRW